MNLGHLIVFPSLIAELPKVNFGTYKLAGDECFAAVRAAIEAGYQGIDTASIYRNESIVGKAIKHAQKSVFLTTKLNPAEMGYEQATKAFQGCLTRLKVGKVDLLLIHWPGKSKLPPDSPEHRQARIDTWKAMQHIQSEGKTRFIGVSNFTINHLEQLREDGATVMPYVNQVELHILLQQRKLREYCKVNNILLQAYSPLGSGGAPVLHELQGKVEDPLQFALKAAQSMSDSIVIKSARPERIMENLKILSDPGSVDNGDLETFDRDRHFCWNPEVVK